MGSAILDREGFYRFYQLNEKDTIEIPYLISSSRLDIYDRKSFKDLKIIDKSYETGKFSYATLVVDTNLIYTAVYLNFSELSFFKDVTLEGSNDNKNWKIIVENEKLFRYYKDDNDQYYRNKISFEPVTFKYLRAKIDDSNSSRTDVLSASIPLVKEEVAEEGELVESFQSRSEDKKEKKTIIECKFARSYAITDLQVDIENKDNYRRDVQIEFYNPVNGKDKWVLFGTGVLMSGSSNKLYLMQYNFEDFQFKSSRMRIVVNNLDNQPLDKISVKPFTHVQNIKIKLEKDKKYVVGYGNAKDQRPLYDIGYFSSLIPLGLKAIELGNEIKILHVVAPVQKPLIGNKMWIWVALIVCVTVIGLFTFKLMKSDNKQSE